MTTINITLDPGAQSPTRAHADDAGLDLHALTEGMIPPHGRQTVATGVHLALTVGTVGLVCPRSGLAAKRGITVLNAPGVVDAGYRGDVSVILHNTSDEWFHWNAGDRIAQLLIMKLPTITIEEWAEFPDTTSRGVDGFGSTGIKEVA